jgi:hypothetical protein
VLISNVSKLSIYTAFTCCIQIIKDNVTTQTDRSSKTYRVRLPEFKLSYRVQSSVRSRVSQCHIIILNREKRNVFGLLEAYERETNRNDNGGTQCSRYSIQVLQESDPTQTAIA